MIPMVHENKQKNKREKWKKDGKGNLMREVVTIIAKTTDLARLDAKLNNTYNLNIKDDKQHTNGKCMNINGKIQFKKF
ncbi:hypothetical protein ACQKNS_18720 [Peribacillus sp. NPDC094092]|uniref:hypothetical protein n=1 Tax=Peribacillus sp. NPDC094092 TaxID=3390611 RepID=UPI003D04FA8D